MKRKMTFLVAVLFGIMLVCSSALAETWTCYQCRKVNSGAYCSNCGAKKPVTGLDDLLSKVSGEISDVKVDPQLNGDLLVTWSDSSDSGPYTVEYSIDNWSVEYYEQDSYKVKRATLQRLIPGATYDITVSNGSAKETVTYKMPKNVFTEFSTKNRYLKMIDAESFSISALEKDPTAVFEMRLGYPSLVKDRQYEVARLALKTPLGYSSKIARWNPFTLEKGYAYYYWNESMHEWLNRVEKDFGSIPTGEYSFEMYVDNEIYAYVNFWINR